MHDQYHFKNRILPFLLLVPQFVVLLVFFLYPAGQALVQSLYIQDAFGLSSEFNGLGNFEELFRDPAYLSSAWTSLVYSLVVSSVVLVLAMVLSWLIVQSKKSSLTYRNLLMVPYAISPAVGGVLWIFLFNPTFGMIAEMFEAFGLHWNHHTNPDQAFALIVLIAVWKQLPYNLLFLTLAMSAISPSLVEAAAVDGAGPKRRFWFLVLPSIGPSIFYLMTMNLAFAFFDSFAIIHQSTQGGPEVSTTTMVYKVFKDGFLGMDQGYSAAQSLVLIVLMSILTLVQFRRMEEHVTYF